MENFERYPKYNRKNTAEHMAEEYGKAGPEQRAATAERDATDWNIDKWVYNRLLGPRMTARLKAANEEIATLDDAYKWLGHRLHEEAESYEKGFNEYKQRLAEVAAAQGLEAQPLPINTFIETVDEYLGDDATIAGVGYSSEYELYSFYGSPEARKRSIDRVIIGDILTEELPVGTEINVKEPNVYQSTMKTEQGVRRARSGLSKQEAINAAKASGSDRIVRMESLVQKQTKYSSGPVGTISEGYMVVSPKFGELLTDNPEKNRMLPGRDRGYQIPQKLSAEGNEYTNYFVRSKFEVETVAEAENELNPIGVKVEVAGTEYSVSGTTPAEVMRAILDGVKRVDYRDEDDEVVAKFQALQGTKIVLPDGKKVGISDLTSDLLESARLPKAA